MHFKFQWAPIGSRALTAYGIYFAIEASERLRHDRKNFIVTMFAGLRNRSGQLAHFARICRLDSAVRQEDHWGVALATC